MEAQQSRSTLCGVIEQLLAQNQDISNRFKRCAKTDRTRKALLSDGKYSDPQHDRNNAKPVVNDASEDSDDSWTIISRTGENSDKTDNSPRVPQEIAAQFAFEEELESSQVYKRAQLNRADISHTTSDTRTNGQSHLSLADVPTISVILLPLSSHEILNRQWYTFGSAEHRDSLEAGVPTRIPAVENAPAQAMADTVQERDYPLLTLDGASSKRIYREWITMVQNPTPGISVSPIIDDPVS